MKKVREHGKDRLTQYTKLSQVVVVSVLVGMIIGILPHDGNDADTTVLGKYNSRDAIGGKTYKTPVPKTMKTPNFFLPLIWSFHTIGRGIRSKAKSVIILQYP